MRILPAVAEHDFTLFADAISALQQTIGEYFAPVQSGVFASPAVARALEAVAAEQKAGIGQTSWEPSALRLSRTHTMHNVPSNRATCHARYAAHVLDLQRAQPWCVVERGARASSRRERGLKAHPFSSIQPRALDMPEATERPYVLHMFTSTPQMSPFDVNMAADAGYQILVPYCNVGEDNVVQLTQDAIFSRGPKGVSRTGIFIGGRDVMQAADMLERARHAMVPPFEVSVFADPSCAYTTAAALVALAEKHLKTQQNLDFGGKRVLILGGTGAVGRVAAAMAASLGADVAVASHSSASRATHVSDEINRRFDIATSGIATGSPEQLHKELARAEVVFATAVAGSRS